MISKELYDVLQAEIKEHFPLIASTITAQRNHIPFSFWTEEEWDRMPSYIQHEEYWNFTVTFTLLLLEEYDYEQVQIEKMARKNSKIHAIIPVHPLPTNIESL